MLFRSDYVIPANDDASKSIDKILTLVTAAVVDGLANRTSEGADDAVEATEKPAREPKVKAVEAPVEVVAETVTEEVVLEAAQEVVAEVAPVAEAEVAPKAEAKTEE